MYYKYFRKKIWKNRKINSDAAVEIKKEQAKEIKITRRGISKMLAGKDSPKWWFLRSSWKDWGCELWCRRSSIPDRRNRMCKVPKWEKTWCVQTMTRWNRRPLRVEGSEQVAVVKELKITSRILDFVLSLIENYLKDAKEHHTLIWLTYLKG